MSVSPALWFCAEDDMVRFESNLDSVKPRKDREGNPIANWKQYISNAMDELERRFRNLQDTRERFEIGLLGHRSREALRDCVASWALHYLFVDSDTGADSTGYLARKAAHYWERGNDIFLAESVALDYDTERDGVIDDEDKEQPFPSMIIRG